MPIYANDNLPPGTWDGDPNAPWNEPEYDPRECPECGSTNSFVANTKYCRCGVYRRARMRICKDCWNKFD